MFSNLIKRYSDGNLMLQIIVGMVLGAGFGAFAYSMQSPVLNEAVSTISILGDLFVGALKAIAPILIFILVVSSISLRQVSNSKGLNKVIILYLVGTSLAAFIAVFASFMFPVELTLKGIDGIQKAAPQTLSEIIKTLVYKIVDNPINAIASANFIGVLAWAIGFGIALRHSGNEVKQLISAGADAVSKIVRFIIKLAPIGIFGLVTLSVYQSGGNALLGYLKLLTLLVGVMLVVAFVVYPLMVFVMIKSNPYPLIFTCVKESGLMAFFTRSSAANVPVNLALCKKLNLNESLYSISIPLGSAINMGGAAITISILALAAVNSISSIEVSFGSALLLSIVSAIGACGASGVAGGSLMLIPLACSLFGISNDIALQVVAIGFIIGVIQDSVETALNSFSDVVFTAAVSISEASKNE